MAEDLYEPTPSKRLRSFDGYSSSPSFSELSCNEDLGYSLRRNRKPLTPIKSRLRHLAAMDYSLESEENGLESQSSNIKIEKRVTRSSNIENGMY